MINKLQIPNSAIKYILFQRTAYMLSPSVIGHLFRIVEKQFSFSLYNSLIDIEAKFGRKRIKELFEIDMKNEYETIKEYLPVSPSTVLDIGCGVAGIAPFIHRHYADKDTHFYLLDKTKTENHVHYGFEQSGAFYNSLSIAKELLCLNDIPENKITILEATEKNDIKIDNKVDLIISLLSWGHHYPVDVYLKQVADTLSDKGRLILDVRKDTGGVEKLKSCFKTVEIILDEDKQQRVFCEK